MEYNKFKISERLRGDVLSEISKGKIVTKMKDCDIARAYGMDKSNYSAMIHDRLNQIGNIEAIADVLGYDVEIKFVDRGKNEERV